MFRSIAVSTLGAALALVMVTAASAADPSTRPAPSTPTDAVSWIVYQSPRGLAVVRPDGTGSTRIFGDSGPPKAHHADLSPDGTRLVFEVDSEVSTDIWIAGVDGTDARVLVGCTLPTCAIVATPAWSPDGTSVAYWRGYTDGTLATGTDVEILDVATGAIRRVASTTGPDYVESVRWSPSGDRLVLAMARFTDSKLSTTEVVHKGLGIVDLDDPTHTIDIVPGLPTYATYPDWHPSTDLLVFQDAKGDPFLHEGTPPALYTTTLDGGTVTRLLPDRPASEPWVTSPSWESDGTGILVTLIHGKGSHTLATVSADGSAIGGLGGAFPVRGAHANQQRVLVAP